MSAADARACRAAIEAVLDILGWKKFDRALSLALDDLLLREERG